jgi:hypothetical protein
LSPSNPRSYSTWPTWARWPPQNHWLSPSGHNKKWWYGWAWNWLDRWMSSDLKSGANHRLIFVTPQPQILLNRTHLGMMTTPKLLIITIWTCQEMMVWMSMEFTASLDVIR